MCKSSLIVDSAACTVVAMREVRNHKSRASQFRNYLVINSVVVRHLIHAYRLVACILHTRPYPFFPSPIH